MYLSRIALQFNQLRPEMLQKWQTATPYASHQWLWQLFTEQPTRHFLFREEKNGVFFVLSKTPPLSQHPLFTVATKPFNPQLNDGLTLDFQLRANPVITRNKQRSDVMMDAKYQARAQGVAPEHWWALQQQAAAAWLTRQGAQHGFRLLTPEVDDFAEWAGEEQAQFMAQTACVKGYQRHRFVRQTQESPVMFSSVDFSGSLSISDSSLFQQALFSGLGKSKALGCGLLMVKRRR